MKTSFHIIFSIIILTYASTIRSYAGNEILLSFDIQLTSDITFPAEVTESVTYSTNVGTSGILSTSGGKITIPKGVTSAAITFDNPSSVSSLNFNHEYSAINSSRISGITIENLPALRYLSLDNNSLSEPVNGQLPSTCQVNYGIQNPIDFVVLFNNLVDIGIYAGNNWTLQILDTFSGSYIPTDAFTLLDNGYLRVNNNYSWPLRIFLKHTSGLELSSNGGMIFNKIAIPFFQFSTDGRGRAVSFTVAATGQQIDRNMVVEYNGNYYEDNTWNISIPFVSYSETDLTISSNINDKINTLSLADMGITKLSFTEDIPLKTINLTGNSLLLSQIPALLRQNGVTVSLGTQKNFTLSPIDGTFTFDLSREISSGGEIEWLDENGTNVSADKYIEENGIYRFLEPTGKIKARITSEQFSDYEICSELIDVDFSLAPLATLIRNNGTIPVTTFSILAKNDIIIKAGEYTYSVQANKLSKLRLPAVSGTTNIFCSDNNSIVILDFSSCGISEIELGTGLNSLETLNLSYNSLNFNTFPRIEGAELKLDGQNPVSVKFDSITGLIEFPEYKDCTNISLIDQQGDIIPEKSYELSDFNDYMVIKESVSNAIVDFTGHPEYPGVHIYSDKINFVARASVGTIYDNSFYTLNENTIASGTNQSIWIIAINGITIGHLAPASSITLPHGIYILVEECGLCSKISI